ncbi:hypothetical protein MMC07_001878 [Pseudocyphellaria aurata]|nr:hypothetical protein [Pseudocyphellaria aurata]
MINTRAQSAGPNSQQGLASTGHGEVLEVPDSQFAHQAIRAYAAYLDELATHLSNAPTDTDRLQKLRPSMKESIRAVIQAQVTQPTTRADLIAQAQRIEENEISRNRATPNNISATPCSPTDAYICVVIGIDVGYKGSKKASVSIWRPHIGVNDVGEKELFALQTSTDQFFRNDAGNLVPDPQASLQLRLEDFGTETSGAKLADLIQSVHISAETLFKLLDRAEAKARRLIR